MNFKAVVEKTMKYTIHITILCLLSLLRISVGEASAQCREVGLDDWARPIISCKIDTGIQAPFSFSLDSAEICEKLKSADRTTRKQIQGEIWGTMLGMAQECRNRNPVPPRIVSFYDSDTGRTCYYRNQIEWQWLGPNPEWPRDVDVDAFCSEWLSSGYADSKGVQLVLKGPMCMAKIESTLLECE